MQLNGVKRMDSTMSDSNSLVNETENADKVPTNADKWFVGTAGAENLGITVCLDVIFYFVLCVNMYFIVEK